VKFLARLIATCFFLGYTPVAPGTVGSLAAVAIAWVVVHFGGDIPLHHLIHAIVLTPFAIWSAGVVASDSGFADPQTVVIDEVVGQWIALAGATHFNWKSVTAAFVLFRLFDVWKPPPARQLERLHGGAGIVMDDVAAGVYAALALLAAGVWFNLY
jgi:phosphatidylglycerophosphatase A